MKTLKQYHKSGFNFNDFIKPLDEVDESLFRYIMDSVSAQYSSNKFSQAGEAEYQEDGIFFYASFYQNENKIFYLGILPEFKQ